jgi:hypothetical protein
MAEVRKVADLVEEHIELYPNKTLGIVTFSQRQMGAIQNEVESRARRNRLLSEHLLGTTDVKLFVKNLE